MNPEYIPNWHEQMMSNEKSLLESQLHNMGNSSLSQVNSDPDNLIRWQLDFKEDLDRIRHLLKGEEKEYVNERQIWVKQDNPDLIPFNKFGEQLIMNIMSFYLNRNTLLSNYDETTINWKVLDFGNQIADLIFLRYEDMMTTLSLDKEIKKITGHPVVQLPNGRLVLELKDSQGRIVYSDISNDTLRLVEEIYDNHIEQKIKLYPLLIMELVDCVHSAYLRALHGGERDNIKTARMVTQTEPLNHFDNYRMPQQNTKTKWYNKLWG